MSINYQVLEKGICGDCGEEKIVYSFLVPGGIGPECDTLCLSCLEKTINKGLETKSGISLEQLDIPCPDCKGEGYKKCPMSCHGFGRCPECGGNLRVECGWCHTTGVVPAGCIRYFKMNIVEETIIADIKANMDLQRWL